MENIGSLFTTLGFKVDNKGLNEYQNKIKSISDGIRNFKNILIGGGVVAGVYKFSKGIADAVANLDALSVRTNTNIETLQEWQLTAERFNVGKENIIQAFQSISDERNKIWKGAKPNNAWYLLGIDPMGEPDKVFENVLKQIEKIEDKGLRLQRLKDLGLNQDLVNLVGKNKTDYKGYYSNMGVLNREQIDSILEMKDAYNQLFTALKLFKDYLGYLISPIKYIIELVARIIHITGTFIKTIFSSKDAIKGLMVVFGLLMWTISPLITIITAICLVVEDLWVYFHGGDSVIGDLVKKFPFLAKVLDVLKGVFLGFIEVIKSVFETLGKLGEWFLKIAPGIFDGFITLLKSVWETLDKFIITPIKWAINNIGKLKFWGKDKKESDVNNSLSGLETINRAANIPTTNNNRQTNISDNKQITNNINISGGDTNKVKQTIIETSFNPEYNMTYDNYNN